MTPTEELLRSAVRASADVIRPDSIAPLDLAAIRRWRPQNSGRRTAGPLATVTLALAAVASLAVALPWVLAGNGVTTPVGVAETGTAPASTSRPGTVPASSGSPSTVPATTGSPSPAPAGTAPASIPVSSAPASSATGPAPSASGGGQPKGVTSGPTDGVPPYYVALTGPVPWSQENPQSPSPLTLTVRATMSGQILAAAAPPAGYGTFWAVAAGGDDTTFLAVAETWHPKSFAEDTIGLFLARYDPAARAVSLTRLPVPPLLFGELKGAAMSPDGRELAIVVASDPPVTATSGEIDLRVYALPYGTVRTWRLTGQVEAESAIQTGLRPAFDTLSWLPDGHTLAFNWTSGDPAANALAGGLRLIDTTGPGGGLLAASWPLLAMPYLHGQPGVVCYGNLIPDADGHSAICAGTETRALAAGTAAAGSAPPPGAGQPVATPTPTGPPTVSVDYGFYDVSPPSGASVSGTSLGPANSDQSPVILWYSGRTRGTLIGMSGSSVFIIRGDSPAVSLPWDSKIYGTAAAW
jgi:hypothetical protein